MNKTVIILTKSRKYKNYCVAGIDFKTGEWVRLVSMDSTINHAVKKIDFTYENGEEAEILDIVNIECLENKTNYYQPENWVYEEKYYWEKKGQVSIDDVKAKIKQIDDEYVFYNGEKNITKEFIETIPVAERYSLKLISPENAKVYVKTYDRLKHYAVFDYNGVNYGTLGITDEVFNEGCSSEGWYKLENISFVLSLADIYPADNSHYKVIASVIEN
ncbi:hypothetical protein E4V42_03740 [Clostridium estertheticum]|uniref:Dual OB-containing domain-containing protein n=1 Tax=Clostridium estertheticum TaxID=238834 RepID=A0A5N7IJS5_9CLOT|nr:hypothetical protein [Clostridium estertheticum]MPQ30549.1 hypothetical protein [Clostridium estertheticum]MPQ61225.1 hypothetical protein [Clostridium estertheticum]